MRRLDPAECIIHMGLLKRRAAADRVIGLDRRAGGKGEPGLDLSRLPWSASLIWRNMARAYRR
jgi:hypothetical protein